MPMLPNANSPLLAEFQPERLIGMDAGCRVTHAEFLHTVISLANRLPESGHFINLCQQRYHFLLVFCAIIARGSINILPPNRSAATLAQIREEHPGALCIVDAMIVDERIVDEAQRHDIGLEPLLADIRHAGPVASHEMPLVAHGQCIAIAYTSGSTGRPKANIKTWGILSGTARLLCRHFIPSEAGAVLIPTVPPQHMYGLETSIMMVLQGRAALYTGETFYPDDIAMAFRTTGKGILVTTPVHLLTLEKSGVAIAGICRVICATAPLKRDLAAAIEQRFGTVIEEIYGFTEAGSVAIRQTTATDEWQLLDGMSIGSHSGALFVSGPQFVEAVPVLDLVELLDGGKRFRLAGRAEDMVNVAGKRASLADLNFKLQSIPGVEDGVILMAGESADISRPLGIVVSALGKRAILEQLARLVDPVFLPRPLIFVERIPRNETGKPQRLELLKIVEAYEHRNE